jgi:lipopolysaccharide biosynthesis regulator YciM
MGEARRAMVLARRACSLAPSELTRARMEPVVRACGREAEMLCEIAARDHVAHGRFDAARELRELLAECDPISVTKKIDAAQLDLQHGDATRAEGLLVLAASQMHEAGRTGEYVRIAETMIAHGRHDPETTLELVRIYLRRGQVTDALSRLALLRRDAPSRLEVVELTLLCQAALGQTNAALHVLRDAFTRGGHDLATLRRLCDRVAGFDSRDPGFATAVRRLRDDPPAPRRGPPPPPDWSTRPARPPVQAASDDDHDDRDRA